MPESFEWILLRSGVVPDRSITEQLDHPEEFIDSEAYMSWEQFFTELLRKITENDSLRQYQKSRLKPYYMQGMARDRIISAMPEKLQVYLRSMTDSVEGSDPVDIS